MFAALQFWRENDQIRIRIHLQRAFGFKADSTRRIFRDHHDRFVQQECLLPSHRAHKIDHARGAAGERRAIGKQTNTILHDAIPSKSANCDLSGNPAPAVASVTRQIATRSFRAIQHCHQCCRNVVTVGDQFATDPRFA